MKQLPKYFVVEKDKNNPLWKEFIIWLNKTYNNNWTGRSYMYYGYDGNEACRGTNAHSSIDNFINDPILITLEEWNECVNGFKVPDSWCVEVTDESREALKTWFVSNSKRNSDSIHNFVGMYRVYSDKSINLGTATGMSWVSGCFENLITFEQFKKYILMQEDKKIIGYKCPFDTFNGNVKAGTVYVLCDALYAAVPISNVKGSMTHSLPTEIVKTWEPVYEQQFRIGDWITYPLEGYLKTSRLREWTSHAYCILDDGNEPFKHLIRAATSEEVKIAETITVSVGGKFDVKIKDGKVYHRSDDITKFVIEMVLFFEHAANIEKSFGGYNVRISDITFSQTGCESKETKLSDWLKIYDLIKDKK